MTDRFAEYAVTTGRRKVFWTQVVLKQGPGQIIITPARYDYQIPPFPEPWIGCACIQRNITDRDTLRIKCKG